MSADPRRQARKYAEAHERRLAARVSDLPRAYEAARRQLGACPIEVGLIGNLIDNECEHLRLPGDPSPPCGCHPGELAPVTALPGVEPDALGRAA